MSLLRLGQSKSYDAFGLEAVTPPELSRHSLNLTPLVGCKHIPWALFDRSGLFICPAKFIRYEFGVFSARSASSWSPSR